MVSTHVEQSTEQFTEQVFGDLVGTLTIALASIGDRLGLFRDLADHGPTTVQTLARRTRIDQRYAQEWLSAMTCAGYLTYDPKTISFTLPAAFSPVVAEELAPMFFGGPLQLAPLMLGLVPQIADKFRTGGGLPQSAYDAGVWEGMERETAPLFENALVEGWLANTPDVVAKLKAGAHVADVGCGSGRAILRLAREYPTSTFVGYDSFPAQIERARTNSAAAGYGERVRFVIHDGTQGLPDAFDIITTFDVVHDAVDPLGLVRSIRTALNPGGMYLMQEYAANDRLEDNIGPLGTFLYGVSVLYCMTTSLAHGGAGMGTAGMTESVVRGMAMNAGFRSTERIEIEDPFHAVYLLRT